MCSKNRSANVLFLVASLPEEIRTKQRVRLRNKYAYRLNSPIAEEVFSSLVGEISREQMSVEGEEYLQKILNDMRELAAV